MKKTDLKTGMLVQLRNGNIYLVINDVLIDTKGFIPLAHYDDDFNYTFVDSPPSRNPLKNKELDIIKISHVITVPYVSRWNEHNINHYLKWEREEDNTIKDMDELKRLRNLFREFYTILNKY